MGGKATKPAPADMTGKVVAVTGANTGIGKETARQLYHQGAEVVLACRSAERAAAAARDIEASAPPPGGRRGKVRTVPLDLCDMASVTACASSLAASGVDVVVANAGINGYTAAKQPRLTGDGFNALFQANYLGHWVLLRTLLPHVARRKGRLVTLTSCVHCYAEPRGWPAAATTKSLRRGYQDSKLMMALAARDLQRRAAQAGLEATALTVSPGAVMSDIFDNMPNLWCAKPAMQALFLTTEQGAATSVAAAADPAFGDGNWRYLVPYAPAPMRGGPLRCAMDHLGLFAGAVEGRAAAPMYDAALADEVGRLSDQWCAPWLKGV